MAMAAEVAAAETTPAKIATATAEGAASAREAAASASAEGRAVVSVVVRVAGAVVMEGAMTRSTVRAVVPTARCRQSTSPFSQVSKSAFVGFDGFDLSIGWVHGSCRHWCTGRSWPARLPNRRWSLGRYPAGSTVVRQVESGGAVVAAEEPQATALAGE